MLRTALPVLLCSIAAAVEVEAAKIATADAAPVDPGTWEVALGGGLARATRAFDADGERVDRGGSLTQGGASLGLTYGLREGLDAGLAIGWDRIHDHAAGAAGEPERGNGVTDLALGAKWRYATWGDEDAGLAGALLPSLTLPLGRDHDDSRSIATASRCWTAGLAAAFSSSLGRWAGNADAGYVQAVGPDRDGYRGTLTADAAIGYQIDERIQPEAELSWTRDRMADGDAPWRLTGTLGVQIGLAIGRLGLGVQRDLAGRSTDLATAAVADLAIGL